ncbi:F-actin capping protein, alpha subunit [Ramaria rubella]|nr:F-actin capping protein, alpha subunit [Ramaria rubella]KAF8587549.1 F-actin capping protein, alpha subunit [Ramaria rubella]
MDDRMASAARFLLQSPPGEINDVLNDVRNIIADDESLQEGIQPALQEYNVAQFVTVDVPGQKHQVIISEAGRVESEDERFRDPRSKTTFVFDHLRLEASDSQPYEPDDAAEPFRAALEAAAIAYISDHFPEGVATVFAKSASKYIIQFVGNKYNPQNFWSGRWRSEYIVDIDEAKLHGSVLINVHYFEQGNVQLSTNYSPTFELTPAVISSPNASSASKILALIEARETDHQAALNDTYTEMGEKTFKGLRRALPLTRQKLDWDKVLGYKLGAELAGSKGVFGP